MNRFLIVTLLVLIIHGYSAFGQLTIELCQKRARNNYPQIQQFDLIEKSKEFNISNANKAYLPQVSFTAIGGYILGGLPVGSDEGSNIKFIGIAQLNQTIWDGGATKSQKEIVKASSELEKASLEVTLYNIRSRVNQLYFGILLVDEQLLLLAQKEKVLKNNVERIKQLNSNGLAYKTDLDEIAVELIKTNQQKKEFQYVKSGYLQMLSLLTGTEINENTALEKPEKELLLLETEITRPELKLYENQRLLIQSHAKADKVNLMPKMGLLGAGLMIQPGISLGSNEMSSLGVVGLSASWNINGLYKNSNRKNLTQLEIEKVNLNEKTFLQNSSLEISQAKAGIQKYQSIIDDDNEIVTLRKTIREGYQLKYENGMCTLIELLDATEKENEALTQMTLHEIQLLMGLYDLRNIMGK